VNTLINLGSSIKREKFLDHLWFIEKDLTSWRNLPSIHYKRKHK